jgi:uncharacterized protein (TIGR02421 family)
MADATDAQDALREDGGDAPQSELEPPASSPEEDDDWRAAETRSWRSYKERIVDIAQQIVDAQRPIRVLQALRWEPAVEEAFWRSKGRELPRVGPEDYVKNELGFDPTAKAEEFETLMRAVDRQLGPADALGRILMATAYEYREVVRMLAARGTRDFYVLSRNLYGSPKDRLPDGKTTVRELGQAIYETLGALPGTGLGPEEPRDIGAREACELLNARFAAYFDTPSIQVEVDDTMLADAAAGSGYVKIRSGARFSQRDIDLLEVHEGWVHIATSLNGQNQPVARWLAKGPPRTAAVQEGLAAIVELLTYRSYPKRARKLNDRILAVDKAEDGASFLDVYDWYRSEGYDDEESFANTRRVFRGGTSEGGAPFTKDACYCKGLVLNYAFIRAAVQSKRAELVPYLFVGKVAHEDIPVLYAKVAEGLVEPPQYLPPMFRDLNGLAIWTAYSSFFFRMGGAAVDDYYTSLFRRADG